MYAHILIATDGSQLADKGLEHGLALAKELGAKVTILTVSEPFPRYEMAEDLPLAGAPPKLDAHHGFSRACRQAAHGILARARGMADLAGVPAETIHVDDARPAEAIVETAQYEKCDLIVMASHGRRGVGRLFFGSQTVETLTHSSVPVLVVR